MRILFDHCVPNPFRKSLPAHEVRSAAQMGWENLKNGKLLSAAAAGNFELFLTVDRNIKHQQNLAHLPIAVIVLDVPTNTPEVLGPMAPFVEQAIAATPVRGLIEINSTGTITRIC